MRYLKTNNRNWRKLCKGEIQVEQLKIDINKERVRDLEKPILFNTEMVKAILEGRKTTTRRIIKGNIKDLNLIGSCSSDGVNFNYVSFGHGNITDINSIDIKERVKAPYLPGDIIYVRETWCDVEKDFKKDNDIDLGNCKYIFKVDDNGEEHPLIEGYVKRWRPSIHMPKKASRIFLKITDVRVERIQDITEDQIKKKE